ncbi:MAG: hypothetical protein LBU75_03340 [Desulfovibrio sp.]|jgi:hypothetical protein|nr:hypothetical protein [Desulfovibrio sp.]
MEQNMKGLERKQDGQEMEAPATGVPGSAGERHDRPGNIDHHDRLDRLEALLTQGMAGIAASVGELKAAGTRPAPAVQGGGLPSPHVEQRLTVLEEGFARMCMVVGRLDQQVQALLAASEDHE